MVARAATLLIPSETRVREFDGKLLLACIAAEQGHECVVGSPMAMHLHIGRLPLGIYIAKDMFCSSARMLRILRGLGHDVVGWDEESLVYISRKLYLRHRVSAKTTSHMRRVFAWGEEDRETKAAAPAFRGIPVEAVGNPRMNLLRPEVRAYFGKKAAALRARYGRYILINSNFGKLNHLLPAERLDTSEANRVACEAANASGLPFDYWQFRDRIFRAMKAMIPVLADAFPGATIVLRPRLRTRTRRSRGCWGPRRSSTMAARRGWVAHLFDRPVICYQPETHELWDLELPNAVSDAVATEAELVDSSASAAMRRRTRCPPRPPPSTAQPGARRGGGVSQSA